MRFTLFTLALGTFLLTGCADDLTGPETGPISDGLLEVDDPTSARSPEAYAGPIEADDMLFATWAGTDGVYSFDFTFEQVPAYTEPNPYHVPTSLHFGGEGICERLDLIEPTFPCRVVEGVYDEGEIRFSVVSEDGVVARAWGSFASDFASFKAKVQYADGTAQAVDFKRGDG